MKNYGLIGYPLSSSFSMTYFNAKFEKEGIDAHYNLYPIENIDLFPNLVENTIFSGLNVTIPYKQQVLRYLDALNDTAKEIGAVNVIQFNREKGRLKKIGYNTDAIGFENSLKPLLMPWHKKALILGTGGASKAVAYVLRKNGIEYNFVSRKKKPGILTYGMLDKSLIKERTLIVNATPLGMYPVDACPDIPYEYIGEKHLLYDLIYNPAKTIFLEKGEHYGAVIKNGAEMLEGQAIAAWKIWNKD